MVLITGGAQGIGLVTAKILAASGWDVCVFDADQKALERLPLMSGLENVSTHCVDISDEAQVVSALQKIDLSKLSAIVNNAAIAINKPIEELELKEWNKVIGINLTSIFILVKNCIVPLKENKGAIVNIASTRAVMSEPNTEAYSSTKGAVIALTHALAQSLGPEIRVNAISPGWIEVRELQKEPPKNSFNHTKEDKDQHTVGRVGKAEDVGNLVAYLLSEKAGFITGQNFIVDGGMTTKMIYK